MKSIEFVLAHFKEGVFDWRKGYRAVCGNKRRTFNIMPWLFAAAAIALGAFLFIRYQNHTTDYLAYDVAQTFTLPDGSKAILQPGAKLSLKPRRNPRSITLDGTALFSVEKMDGKPFTVKSEAAYVKVLGTVFQLSGNTLEVYEGKVLFALTEDSEGIVVTAGEKAVIRGDKPEKTVRFVYDDTPLEKVLADLSKYYGVSLNCAKTHKKLTAEFPAESLEEIVDLIEAALDVEIEIEK